MGGEWRDTVGRTGYAPERVTTAMYQAHVAGKPRLSGAGAALEVLPSHSRQHRRQTLANPPERERGT